MKNIYFSSMR